VGDYNDDGIVDSSDYITWRRQAGTSSLANRDPSNTGVIGEADYLSWRAHVGQTAVSGSGSGSGLISGDATSVPEPSTLVSLAFTITAMIGSRRRASARQNRR
jgi:hypothetical protein